MSCVHPRPLRPLLLAALLWAMIAAGCRGPEPAVVPRDPEARPTVPVVYVPGISGTGLRERATGRLLWGSGRNLLLPRDGGYDLVRPIGLGLTGGDPRVAPTATIDRLRVAVLTQPVYRPIKDALIAGGYRLGDLDDDRPRGTAFFFAYDWRLDNVHAARRLGEALERLRRARGERRLVVDLICQSNGAHVCRYLAKYGGAALEEAEAGPAPGDALDVRKLILLGTSNGGGLRMLRELNRGRSYLFLGRFFRPEIGFTCPSFFQDLPVYRPDLFLDPAGRPLAVDLFDADAWRRYGWSVYDPETRARIARRGRSDLFGDEAARLAFLRHALDYARRFHDLLHRDAPGLGATRIYSIQSRSEETPARAVLRPRSGGWETLFTGDPELRRDEKLHALATAPGDGHGTVASQAWLSPQEQRALVTGTFYVEKDHFALILQPETRRKLLEYLSEDAPSDPPL